MAADAHSRPEGSAPYFAGFIEGRRGQVLDAALTVFSSKGYDRGTMREIASVVGVTEPALYRHYAGKEALYKDLIATAGDRAVSEVRLRMSDVRPYNLRESLAGLIAGGPHNQGGPGDVVRTLVLSTPHQPTLLQAFREHVAKPMFAAMCEFVPRVDEAYGIVRSTAETEARSRAIMSLFVGYFMTSMMLGDAGQDGAIVDAVLAITGWDEQPASPAQRPSCPSS